MTAKYKVEVKSCDGWTTHSEHASYRDAVDQSDMVHGRVRCGNETMTTNPEVAAYISQHDDDDEHDADELERLFRLTFGREPDDQDREDGIWSLICAAMD